MRLVLTPEGAGLHAQVLRGRACSSRGSCRLAATGRQTPPLPCGGYSLEQPDAPIEDVVLLGDGDEGKFASAVGRPVRRAALSPAQAGGLDVPPDCGPLVGLARQWLGLGRYPVRIEAQGWQEKREGWGRSQAVLAVLAAAALFACVTVLQVDRQRQGAEKARRAESLSRRVEQDRRLLTLLTRERDRLAEQWRAVGGGGSALAAAEPAPDAPPLELLRRVSGLAPAGVWLTQVTFERGKPLQLLGPSREAGQATLFLRSLERTGGFRRTGARLPAQRRGGRRAGDALPRGLLPVGRTSRPTAGSACVLRGRPGRKPVKGLSRRERILLAAGVCVAVLIGLPGLLYPPGGSARRGHSLAEEQRQQRHMAVQLMRVRAETEELRQRIARACPPARRGTWWRR